MIMKTATRLLTALLVLAAPLVQATEFPYAMNVTRGFRHMAKVVYTQDLQPPEVKPLKIDHEVLPPDAKARLDTFFAKSDVRIAVMSQGDRIIYETYRTFLSHRDTPLGYSMSKSLTGLLVGKALCDGHLRSLDDTLGTYVASLQNTVWGEATIFQLLTMTSGAFRTLPTGMKSETEAAKIRSAYEGLYNGKLEDFFNQAHEKSFPPGTVFNYSNYDTLALGLLIEAATGKKFMDYFSASLWRPVGAAQRGAWIVGNQGETMTFMGFSATPHDWIRLGRYVLDQLKQPETCMGKFVQAATTTHILTGNRLLGQGYGFQIWTNCGRLYDFCFVGFGGQFLYFNKAKDVVIYQHAAMESHSTYIAPRMAFGQAISTLPQ